MHRYLTIVIRSVPAWRPERVGKVMRVVAGARAAQEAAPGPLAKVPNAVKGWFGGGAEEKKS